MPVGAYGASHEMMSHIAPDGSVYQAGTLSANPVAMSAGFAALRQLVEPNFFEEQEYRTKYFVSLLQDYCIAKKYPVHFPTIGSIFWIAFAKNRIQRADQIDPDKMELFKILHHELLQNGCYLGPSGYEVGFVSAAHKKTDLEEAASFICAALDKVFAE